MILADEAFDGASGNFLDLYWMLGDHQGSVTSVLSHNSGQTSVVQDLAYTPQIRWHSALRAEK